MFLDTNRSGQVDGGETVISRVRQEDDRFVIDVADGPGGSPIAGLTFDFRGFSDKDLEAVVRRGNSREQFSMNRSGNFE